MRNLLSVYRYFIIYIFMVCALTSCHTENQQSQEGKTQQIDTSAVLLKYGGNLFTVPSPFQIAEAMSKRQVQFIKRQLNQQDSLISINYSTIF